MVTTIAIANRRYPFRVKTKSLPEAQMATARNVIRQLVDDHFKGVVLAAARAWDVPQSLLGDFLNEKKGLGMNSFTKIAKATGIPFQQLSGIEPYSPSSASPEPARAALTLVRDERYAIMPTVRAAALDDGIDADFVRNWETKLDFDDQPTFSMLYDLLRASWNVSRGKLIAKRPSSDEF